MLGCSRALFSAKLSSVPPPSSPYGSLRNKAVLDSRIFLQKGPSPFAHFQYFSSVAQATAKSLAGTPRQSSTQRSDRNNYGLSRIPVTSKLSRLRLSNFNAAFSTSFAPQVIRPALYKIAFQPDPQSSSNYVSYVIT